MLQQKFVTRNFQNFFKKQLHFNQIAIHYIAEGTMKKAIIITVIEKVNRTLK